METTTILTLWVVAKVCSILAWPAAGAVVVEVEAGLEFRWGRYVAVLAPEQARFRPLTPPPM